MRSLNLRPDNPWFYGTPYPTMRDVLQDAIALSRTHAVVIPDRTFFRYFTPIPQSEALYDMTMHQTYFLGRHFLGVLEHFAPEVLYWHAWTEDYWHNHHNHRRHIKTLEGPRSGVLGAKGSIFGELIAVLWPGTSDEDAAERTDDPVDLRHLTHLHQPR